MADAFKLDCTVAKSAFDKYAADLTSLIKAPLAAIRQVNRMARKISNALLSDFNTIMGGVNDLINSLPNASPSVTTAMAAIGNLQQCAAVLNTPGAAQQLALAKSALGKCTKYANAPKFVHDYINKMIVDAAMASYNNAVQNNVFAKINKVGSDYTKLLKSTGIQKNMDTMAGLVDCMSSFCANVSKELSILEGYQDKLGLSGDNTITDAANNLITKASAGLKKEVTDTQKDLIKNCNKQLDSAKETISTFKLEIKSEG